MRAPAWVSEGFVPRFNNCVVRLRDSPRVGPLVRRHLTTVTYVGRRSGREFTTPVAYKRAGDTVTIGVQMPARKVWWRNFLDAGGQVTLELDGAQRTGHAIATEDPKGRVTVTVRLS